MTGWQVQEMWERDSAALWERQNRPDPAEKQMEAAAADMLDGNQWLDYATDRLYEAVAELGGTPMADRVESLVNQVEDLRIELKSLADKYRKGVRE